MEAVIFIGLQASGKSTFFAKHFSGTHIHINLDTLKTRKREQALLQSCLAEKKMFVIDNTNPTASDRRRYIDEAKAHGFRVVGYYFRSSISESIRRNDQRVGKERIDVRGILATHARLELPTMSEGFDALYYVRLAATGEFTVEE